jgi:hypothetical protein
MAEQNSRISIRVTAAEKIRLTNFCRKNNLQQKKFVLNAIDRALKMPTRLI